jgi:hypothetical protein
VGKAAKHGEVLLSCAGEAAVLLFRGLGGLALAGAGRLVELAAEAVVLGLQVTGRR